MTINKGLKVGNTTPCRVERQTKTATGTDRHSARARARFENVPPNVPPYCVRMRLYLEVAHILLVPRVHCDTVRGGQTRPRRPRLVVSLSTCPSLPPFPPHTALYQVLQ